MREEGDTAKLSNTKGQLLPTHGLSPCTFMGFGRKTTQMPTTLPAEPSASKHKAGGGGG